MRSRAWELKRDFPDAVIVLNGAVKTTAECRALLDEVHDGVRIDGVMVGRAAYQTPWMLSEVDSVLYGESCRTLTREAVIAAVEAEVEQYYAADEHVTRAFARHLNGLCQGFSAHACGVERSRIRRSSKLKGPISTAEPGVRRSAQIF